MATCTRISLLSGERNSCDLPTTAEKLAQWDLWDRGPEAPLIQDYFSELSDCEREFVLTGIMQHEWEDAFSEDEV